MAALAAAVAITLAACSSSTQHGAAPAVTAKASASATTPKDNGSAPDTFWADDKAAPEHPDLDTYRTKWAYLQQECTEQGQALSDIVIKTQARQKSASRWEAMNYMSALLSGPASDCAPFAG